MSNSQNTNVWVLMNAAWPKLIINQQFELVQVRDWPFKFLGSFFLTSTYLYIENKSKDIN